MKVIEIEGIGAIFAEKLNKIEIFTDEDLLVHGATRTGRKRIAAETGIFESRILSWVNMVDLCRIKGIGPQFAELLHAAGVDTVNELKNRNAENLHAKLVDVQAEQKITKAVPALSQVIDFINQAKGLEPVVSY